MSNVVVSVAEPGRELSLAEPVRVGDILRIGQPMQSYYSDGSPGGVRDLVVHVAQAFPGAPCNVIVGDPTPYAGMGYVWRYVNAGEPVVVVGNARAKVSP